MVMAALQVITDIRGRHAGDSATVLRVQIVWKWMDVAIRQMPILGDVYRQTYNFVKEMWHTFLAVRSSSVYNIKLVKPHDGSVRHLDDAWRSQSRVGLRPEFSNLNANASGKCCRRERFWAFTPSNDYVIQYDVKHSFLQMSFLAFYPKNTPSVFPPAPMRIYWKAPQFSAIESATWSSTGAAADPSLVQYIQQSGGPHQILPGLDPASFDRCASDNARDPHEWSWSRWTHYFPAIFRDPEHAGHHQLDHLQRSQLRVATKNMSASERRRTARLREAQTQAGSKPSIIVTRADQTLFPIPLAEP